MAIKFREKSPTRTFTKTYKDYRNYKQYLKADFNGRCGYTDSPDLWFGGVVTFHIDHHKPWKKYPTQLNLKTDYSNLVYCCSYVNILKSDDSGDYIDPCDVDFNDHFERGNVGQIIPKKKSTSANYMYMKLKLYLTRYEVIWLLDDIYLKMRQMKALIDNEADPVQLKELKVLQGELGNLMVRQLTYLGLNQ